MKRLLVALILFALPQAGLCASVLTTKLDFTVEGTVDDPVTGVVSAFLREPELMIVKLKEEPPSLLGFRSWIGSVTKEVQLETYDVKVRVQLIRTENAQGVVSWLAQVFFGDEKTGTAGVSAARLGGLRLMAKGDATPAGASGDQTFRPSVTVQFK